MNGVTFQNLYKATVIQIAFKLINKMLEIQCEIIIFTWRCTLLVFNATNGWTLSNVVSMNLLAVLRRLIFQKTIKGMILGISLRWIKVATIVRQNFNLTRVRCKWYCCYNTHLVVEYFDWHFSQRRKHEGKESLIGILYLTAFQSNTLINWHKTLQNTKISLYEIPWKTCSCSLSPLPWYLT